MSEPRGHRDMYGALLVSPNTEESDLGVIFMHNNGYSTGCGHAVIAIAKVIFEIEKFKSNSLEIELGIDHKEYSHSTKLSEINIYSLSADFN